MFGDDLPGVFGQRLGLRQQLEAFKDFRIGFRLNFQAFFLAVGIDENFALDVGLEPVVVVQQVGLGERNFSSSRNLRKSCMVASSTSKFLVG